MRTSRLDGKVAIVTGASQGIGLAIVRMLAAEGAQVVACARSTGELDQIITSRDSEQDNNPYRQEGGSVSFIACDVTDETQVAAVVEETARRHGRIDVLCNNAGILRPALLVDTTQETWDSIMDVNVRGMFFFIKHAAPVMAKGGRGGSIVNTGSISSYVGEQMSSAYVASKGAVLMLTKNAAAELAADGIRVNMIAPGCVDTPMNEEFFADIGGRDAGDAILRKAQPLGGLIPPEDIANVVLFLASEESRSMTGASLLVDGGLMASWDHFA